MTLSDHRAALTHQLPRGMVAGKTRGRPSSLQPGGVAHGERASAPSAEEQRKRGTARDQGLVKLRDSPREKS